MNTSDLVFEGLLNAYKNHILLGEKGKSKDKKNRFGDMALRGDVEAEEEILKVFDAFASKNDAHILCVSEEMGVNDLNPQANDHYFAVFDGLDGSGNFLQKGDWGYGTMVAVAKGNDPTYDDFEVAGLAMMDEGWVVLASKNKGISVFDVQKNKTIGLNRFDSSEGYNHFRVLANKYFPEELSAIGENNKDWPMTGSTAASIAAICIGDKVKDKKHPKMNMGWQGLIEVTRKGNLEQPVLYLMANVLGGVMVDSNGRSIGKNKFKVWGQKKVDGTEDRRVVVTAKSRNIALEIIKKLDNVSE